MHNIAKSAISSLAMLSTILLVQTASAQITNYAGCITAPLPTTPKDPSVSTIVSQGPFGSYSVTVWREPCLANPSQNVVLARFAAVTGSSLTAQLIEVEQAGVPLSAVDFTFWLDPPGTKPDGTITPGSIYSTIVVSPVTTALVQSRFGTIRLKENDAFTLRFQGFASNGFPQTVSLNVPAKATVVPLSRRGGVDLDGQGKSALVVSGIVNGTSSQQLTVGRLSGSNFQWTNIAGPGSEFRLLPAVDFAGNGKSDLPMLRETPLNSNGQGSAQFWPDFSGASVVLRDVKPAWDVQAVGDLDGDGFGDLVWRFRGQSPNVDDQGVSYVWFTNGTGVTQVRKRGGAPLTWTLLGAADLNGDGSADMIYVSPANSMRALMATPNRTCANLNGGSIAAGFAALKLADFSGQRRGDVLIRNAATGEVRVIGLNASGLTLPLYTGAPDDPNASCTASTLSVNQVVFNIGSTDPTWTIYATGDFNGDGIFDVVWKRPDNTLTVWLMAANGAAPTIINNAGAAPSNTSTLPLH